jgi:biopolymer transport protein ExbD
MTPVAPDAGLRAEINVTPLVDVVLVLLVILLLVSPMLEDEIPIDVPSAAHATAPADAKLPRLVLGADGSLALDGVPLPSDGLAARLQAVYAGRPERGLVLAADGTLDFARIVGVLDACRAAGIERIGIAVEPRKEISS